nr:MAG TPA: hypothetical protein [Microviridae sp.]
MASLGKSGVCDRRKPSAAEISRERLRVPKVTEAWQAQEKAVSTTGASLRQQRIIGGGKGKPNPPFY